MKVRSGVKVSTRRRRHAVYGTTPRRRAEANESADSQLRDDPLVIQIRRVIPAGRDGDSGAAVGDEEHRGRDPEDAPPIVNSRVSGSQRPTRPAIVNAPPLRLRSPRVAIRAAVRGPEGRRGDHGVPLLLPEVEALRVQLERFPTPG